MVRQIILKQRSGKETRLGEDWVEPLRVTSGHLEEFTSIEVAFDDHYGIRLLATKRGTVVSFREAATWTAPVNSVDFIKIQVRKRQAGVSKKSRGPSRTSRSVRKVKKLH